MSARTPLHDWHAAHGARFSETAGWQTVAAYGGAAQEVAAARAGLGLADVSAFAKWSMFSVRGTVCKDSIPRTPNEEWLACRLTDDHVLFLAARPNVEPPTPDCIDVTSAYAGFVVLGPHLDALLRRLTHLDVRCLDSSAQTMLARIEAILVRSAEFSLPAMRIYVSWDLGEYVWERLLEAGAEWAITPLGLEALAMLRTHPT